MKPRIASADGLKGIAILAVIFTHTMGRFLAAGKDAVSIGGYHVSPWTWLINARAGVSVFFIVSGFLLSLPYAEGRKDMSFMRDVRDFWIGRARRLLPLYYLALIAILAIGYESLGFRETMYYALLLGSFIFPFVDWYPAVPPLLKSGFGPLWYVGTLCWLLLAFPVLLRSMKRFGVIPVMACALILNSAVRIWGALPGSNDHLLLLTFRLRLDEFVLGMAIAFIGSSKRHLPNILMGAAVMTAGFLLTDAVHLQEIPSIALACASLLIGGGAALLIRGALSLDSGTQRKLFPDWLRSLGTMSYPLYLFHGIVILNIGQASTARDHVILYGITFITAWLLHTYIEKPLTVR